MRFVVALIAAVASAADETAAFDSHPFYYVEGKRTAFVATEDYTLGESCPKKGEVFDCDAYRALARASRRLIRPHSKKGGTSDGPLICRGLGGAVLVGRSELGAENAFCKFKDGSLVSAASFIPAAAKNDERGTPQ